MSEDEPSQKPLLDRAFLKASFRPQLLSSYFLTVLQGCRNEKRAIYRRLAPFHVSLQAWEVPKGWSNKPDNLWVLTEFAGEDENSAKVALYHKFGIPNARPVLVNSDDEIVIDGGDRRYYAWDRLNDYVYGIQETDLDVILETLCISKSLRIRCLELEFLGELTRKS